MNEFHKGYWLGALTVILFNFIKGLFDSGLLG